MCEVLADCENGATLLKDFGNENDILAMNVFELIVSYLTLKKKIVVLFVVFVFNQLAWFIYLK